MRSCVFLLIIQLGLLTSSSLAGMCHRHARISCIPFSLLDLPEFCQLVLIPLLAPSKTCPIPVYIDHFVFHSFEEWVVGVFNMFSQKALV